MKIEYSVIKTSYLYNKEEKAVYGIAVLQTEENETVLEDAVYDISSDLEGISALADKCNKLELSPLHLREVIEDYFGE